PSPHPPASPLVPYTTLFRSPDRGRGHPALRDHLEPPGRRHRRRGPDSDDRGDRRAAAVPAVDVHLRGPPARAPGLAPPRPPRLADRKSTRLNSSHVSISYAV